MKKQNALPPLLLGVCLLITTSVACAEGDDRAAYADYLFQQGVALMQKNDCAAAVPKFLSSYRLDPAAATLMNVATCYGKSGQTGSAWRTYRKAAKLADAEHDAALKAQAQAAQGVLDPLLTKLQLRTTNKDRPVSLTVNGEPIAADEGTTIPLDPGENVIEAFAPGHESWRHTVSAREPGMLLVVEVPELPQVKAAYDGSHWRTTAIVVGSVGVASLVTGLGFGLSAKSAHEDSAAECDATHCNAHGHELEQRALDHAAVSTITIGLGALATAAGVAIWLAAPTPKTQAVRVMPLVDTKALGLGIEGTL